MKTKEQLLEELKVIEEKELNDLIEKHYPEFKKLEGKCFKYKNSYSLPENESDYWFKYIKILKIEKENINKRNQEILCTCKTFSFQKDKYGEIKINPNDNDYVHFLIKNNIEITNDEFKKEYNKLLNDVNIFK